MKIKEISEYIGISPRRIQQLAREGMIPREGRGEYDLKAVVQGYISYLKVQLDYFNGVARDIGGGEEIDCALVPAEAPAFAVIPFCPERGEGADLKMSTAEWAKFGAWAEALKNGGKRRKLNSATGAK